MELHLNNRLPSLEPCTANPNANATSSVLRPCGYNSTASFSEKKPRLRSGLWVLSVSERDLVAMVPFNLTGYVCKLVVG
ncbi:hypothetical protein AMTR_s00072p00087060 [Amborella trichopoda]|uniref:Uncharacterized protein n=1 Tax=Amborella trichopoda TaxID=13333 RepID=W1NPA2_AMBTC|nr:hypothetical protein AMTR_s00072p00087060 [Amborella trichopoda]